MTIDEAISHERGLADYYNKNNLKIESKKHKQLAEWLAELKSYRTLDKTNFSDGYNRAIDDFVRTAKEYEYCDITNNSFRFIEFLAEQLKGGGVDAGSI